MKTLQNPGTGLATFLNLSKKNMSLSLKNHRFNHLMDCSLTILYHFDDIALYLDKVSSINNGITILYRSFVEMDILKPIFAAISLLGLHITRPFHSILQNPETNYSTLLKVFPMLYKDLTEQTGKSLLTTEKVCDFVDVDIFELSLPHKCLLTELNACIMNYGSEIEKFLNVCLKMFADGFSFQKGAIFGFGSVLKICDLSASEIQRLDDNVQVHNLGEERSAEL